MPNNSNRRTPGRKPKKPGKDFPFYAHSCGRWAKKVQGRTVYFTHWKDDPKGVAALKEWCRVKDDPRWPDEPLPDTAGLTVADLLNQFLTSKRELVETSELAPRSFAEYLNTGEMMVAAFGRNRKVVNLRAADFEKLRKAMAKRNGPVRLGNLIQRVRSIFKFAVESGWIDNFPRFGPSFKKPSKKVLRTERAKAGPRMLEAEDIRRLLDAADVQVKAMILLGINAGLGTSD